MKKKLIVIIPAYNEGKTISSVIEKILSIKFDEVDQKVIVIDDGSTDKTKEIGIKAGAVVISHDRNQGVGKAFQRGIEEAIILNGDIIVNIDADGQFDAQDIPFLIKPILLGKADFVSGDRFIQKDGSLKKPPNMPVSKYYGNLLMSKFISFLAGQKFSDVSCGFRAYSRKAALMLNLMGHFTYTQETFIEMAFKDLQIVQVPVSVRYFEGRVSRVANNLFVYAFRTLKIIIRAFRDYRPMLFFIYVSMPLFFVGVITGIFVLTYYISVGKFSPYKSIGFISLYTLSLSIVLWIAGFIADMFVRVRMNQEKIIYYLRKNT